MLQNQCNIIGGFKYSHSLLTNLSDTYNKCRSFPKSCWLYSLIHGVSLDLILFCRLTETSGWGTEQFLKACKCDKKLSLIRKNTEGIVCSSTV